MSEKLSVGSTIELTIDKLSYNGGRGVGRHFNFVFFIPGTAPGDLIKAKITKLKKSFGEAQLLEIIKASEQRVDPKCPVFGKCGGCTWQHISYDEQLKQKSEILKFSLRNYWNKDIPVTASEKQFGYRNRIQVHQKQNTVGFHARGSNKLIDIKECHIADPLINGGIEELKKWVQKEKTRFEIAITRDLEVIVQEEGGKNPHHLFSQVNTEMNEVLISRVLKLTAGLNLKGPILDLYAGNGNFSFPLQAKFKRPIKAVELSKSSIKQGKSQVEELELTDIKFIESKVGHYLKGLPALAPESLIIIDPPRTGCEPLAISQILRLKPEALIYISCNLPMLSKDLKILTDTYDIEHLSALDMFPQTEQMETICLLRLKKD